MGRASAAVIATPNPLTNEEWVTRPVRARATSGKLAFVDALRGIAALMVITCHVAYIPSPNLAASPPLLRLIHAGQSGVVLFFMISAFTLCLSFEARKTDFTITQTRDYYLRRLFRILPLFLISIPIAWLRDLVVYSYPRPLYQTLASGISTFIPNNYQGLVWASWTLNIELLFYLIFPLVFRICNSMRRALLGLAACVFADLTASSLMEASASQAISLHFTEIRNSTLMHLDNDIRFSILHNLQFFMMGIVFFYFYRDYVTAGTISKNVGRFLSIVGLSAFALFVFYGSRSIDTVLYGRNLFIGITFLIFIFGFSIHRPRLFVSRWITSLGIISYSLYLLHPPLIAFFFTLYSRIYSPAIPATASYLICLLITLATLVPISALSFRYIEKPGIALGKNLIAKL
jgi:peptidoglycan/LPS O-acetylase OafA/YrhL